MSTFCNDPVFTQGAVKTSTDLSTKMYYIVKEASDGVQLCGDKERPIGILENKPVSTATFTDYALIRRGGSGKVKLASGVTKGDKVASDASGLGQTLDDSTAGWYTGFAKETGVASDIIEIDVQIGYFYHA